MMRLMYVSTNVSKMFMDLAKMFLAEDIWELGCACTINLHIYQYECPYAK